MINEQEYLKSSGIINKSGIKGGQELILHEIIGALYGCKRVFLPFAFHCGTLNDKLLSLKIRVISDFPCTWLDIVTNKRLKFDSVYFGTPTIVNDRSLFEPDSGWTKKEERKFVKRLCSEVENRGCRRIVSGLGSGDISVDERLEDMGGGRIVCFKDFGEFQDWVLVRDL